MKTRFIILLIVVATIVLYAYPFVVEMFEWLKNGPGIGIPKPPDPW